MDVELVLNELSFKKSAHEPPANDGVGAKKLMFEFISTLSAVKNTLQVERNTRKINITLCSPHNLQDIYLAPEYRMARWMNDASVDKEHRLLFITLATKKPHIDENERNTSDEFLYQGEPTHALGYAFQYNHLAISLKSDACWDTPSLRLEHNQLTNDGEVLSEQVDVTHASCQEHVLFHKNWLQEFVRENLQLAVFDGTELWKRKEELFPGLLFCESVKHQLQGVLHGQLLLDSIYNRLSELEQFCADWSQGSFDPQKLPSKTTPESTTTLKMFEAEHTFRCPDDQYHIFSWHVRLTPDAWRIYFYVEDDKKSLIIGHIGHKLPNMLYHT
jgi:hypothetical protein